MNVHVTDQKRDPAGRSPAKGVAARAGDDGADRRQSDPHAARDHRRAGRAHGEAPALLSDRETLSYRALAARANRYARWALAQGVAKGDTVCLLMPNRPEYMAVWLGITRVGGVVALLNTNLTGRSLAHCIEIVAPRHMIVAAELLESYAGARPHLTVRPGLWAHGADAADFARIDRDLERYSDGPLDRAEQRTVTIDDKALYIYTSGTTGLPKAANVSHARVMTWSHWFAGMMDTRPDDRMYDCLPMYHSVGGVVATGALLVNGGSVVIREKFSARQFWDDVARWDCTLFQYIGELCRYLVNAPPHPRESEAPPAARLRQRVAAGRVGGVQEPLRHSAHSRVLCGDRRQLVALQRRGQARRDRPHAAVPRAPFPGRAGEIRRRARRAAARRGGALHPLRPERGRRGDRPDRADQPGRPLRGLHRCAGIRTRRSCATCSSRATPGFAPAT